MAEKLKGSRIRLLAAPALFILVLAVLWPQPLAWAYLNLGSLETNRFLVNQEGSPPSQRAESDLSRAAALGRVRAYRKLSQLQFHRGEYQDARESLYHWVVQRPDDLLGHWYLGRIYEAEGNRAAAIGEWRQAEAFHHLLHLADKESDRGRWKEAIDLYTAAIEISAERGSRGLAQRWDYIAERGWEAHQHLARALWRGMGDIEAAVKQYDWASRLAPWNPNLCIEVAAQFEALGRWDEAMTWLERAHALDPESADTLLWMAQNRLLAGRPADAEHRARMALKLSPDRPTGWITLARSLMARGEHQQAVDELRRGIASDARGAEIHYWLAVALRDSGRMAEAEDSYRAALSLQPGDPLWQQELGALLMAGGRYAEAISLLEEAVQGRPGTPALHLDLATAYRQTGRQRDARAEYEKVLQLSPDNEAARLGLLETSQ